MSKVQDVTKMVIDEMRKQGISKEKMAEMIGCHCQSLYKWGQGGNASVDLLDKALRVLGMTVTLGERKDGKK